MMVTETAPVAEGVLPVARLRDHLRLGSGFAEDQLQDGLLAGFLRAAMASIEGRTGKVLIQRAFQWDVSAWRDGYREVFPVAPVVAVQSVSVMDAQGGAVAADAGFVADSVAPQLVGAPLPEVPQGGVVRVVFDAGYGADFDAIPADLAQAVLMLAAHYYEHRGATGLDAGCTPFGVSALIDRYRPMRLSLGGGQ